MIIIILNAQSSKTFINSRGKQHSPNHKPALLFTSNITFCLNSKYIYILRERESIAKVQACLGLKTFTPNFTPNYWSWRKEDNNPAECLSVGSRQYKQSHILTYQVWTEGTFHSSALTAAGTSASVSMRTRRTEQRKKERKKKSSRNKKRRKYFIF